MSTERSAIPLTDLDRLQAVNEVRQEILAKKAKAPRGKIYADLFIPAIFFVVALAIVYDHVSDPSGLIISLVLLGLIFYSILKISYRRYFVVRYGTPTFGILVEKVFQQGSDGSSSDSYLLHYDFIFENRVCRDSDTVSVNFAEGCHEGEPIMILVTQKKLSKIVIED